MLKLLSLTQFASKTVSRTGLALLLLIAATVSGPAAARCMEGASFTTKSPNGTVCVHTCTSGAWEVECTAPGPNPVNGTLTPSYMVISVIYAPPGRTGSSGSSSVRYGSSSSAGVVVSGSNSFSSGFDVTVSAEGGGASIEGSFGYKRSAADSTSLEVTKGSSFAIRVASVANDGVNHDQDQIWLWLSPVLKATLSGDKLSWFPDPDVPQKLQFVKTEWLKDPSKLPDPVKTALEGSGITSADYPEILKANPFSMGVASPDPNRFRPTNYWLPYQPDAAETSTEYSISSANVAKSGAKTTIDTNAGLAIGGGVDFGVVKTKLKVAGKWTWSTTASTDTSNSVNQMATVVLSGPSQNYTGGSLMEVLYDTAFRTFLFVPKSTVNGFAGRLNKSNSRAIVDGIRVELQLGRTTYTTFTNRDGEFRFPESVGTGSGRIRFATLPARQVSVGPGRRMELRVP